MIDWEELEQVLNAAPQANSLAGPPLGPQIATTATATPAVAAPAQDMPEDALHSPQGDASPGAGVVGPRGRINALEHWRRNLERFPVGHIGHEYARAALGRLAPKGEGTLLDTDAKN